MRFIAILVLVALAFASSSVHSAEAKGWITELDQDVEIRFPDDVVFAIEFISSRPVESVSISFKIIGQDSSRVEPATLEEGETSKAEYVLRTRGGAGSLFIPVGARVTYHWIFEDADGNTIETDPVEFLYLDPGFEWEAVTEGMITVYYYGPVETRASTVLETVVITLDRVGALLETELTEPIRIVMYNNPLDMQPALPFRSSTTRSGLATLGQAYDDEGVLLIMAFASSIRGNVSHEVTHLLVAQAAEGPGVSVPAWLNEGLAEYGNIEPGFSYDLALLYSVRRGKLFPITSMTGMPGEPEDAILVYGQARNVVKFMADTYGAGKIAELLRVFNELTGDMDAALMQVYGVDRVGLDNLWRESIGLPPLPESQVEERAEPTPIPTLVPFGASTPTPIPVIESTPSALLPGDITGDDIVDIDDLTILKSAYGAGSEDPAYRLEADLNGDQVVNYLDLAILGAGYTGP